VVRLVVLVLAAGLISACSVSPKSGSAYDPRHSQSTEISNSLLLKEVVEDDLLRLDEGRHHPAVQVLLTQAEQARQAGNNNQALAYLDQARQIQPRNSAIFYRQAWMNYQIGELQQVRQLLQRAKLFLRTSVANYDVLQRRINTLQAKVDAKLMY
jgi:tetratricopeptide (TPR) repeat protein